MAALIYTRHSVVEHDGISYVAVRDVFDTDPAPGQADSPWQVIGAGPNHNHDSTYAKKTTWQTETGGWRLHSIGTGAQFTPDPNSFFQWRIDGDMQHFRFRWVAGAAAYGHTQFAFKLPMTGGVPNPGGMDGPVGWCAFGRSQGGSRLLWMDVPHNSDMAYLYDPMSGANFGYDLDVGNYFYGQGFFPLAT